MTFRRLFSQNFRGVFSNRKFPIVGLALLTLISMAPLARATCTLYEGDNALPAIQQQLKQLNATLDQLPEIQRDYCQTAHLEYRMSRWFPEKAEHHLTRCMENVDKVLKGEKNGTAFFLRGLCRGRLGEARGLWASLEVIEPFKVDMTLAVQIDPTVDFGGPHRALGKLYYELPFFMGGDTDKSIEHMEKAVKIGPEFWENHYYLAQSYIKDSRYRDAKKELVLARDLAATVREDPDMASHKKNINELMQDIQRILE